MILRWMPKERWRRQAPGLFSTSWEGGRGRYFDDIQSLELAAEGTIVCNFKEIDIANVI